MEAFATYSHAITSLALWALVITVLSGFSTRGRIDENRAECGKPKRNYDDPWYRSERAFMNAVETSGPFIAATVAAILIGASPFWVNLFASIFVIARIAMGFVHIRTTNQPARSMFFAVGLVCILGLVVLTIMAAF
ncbi:MAPEG family protein [Sulfitobacter marinus]|uniref:MAPEG family protein n=1 Tax=Sulfitobacter marinus TaxID=394264 RepID=A0A1I6S8V4_9RHOB|nr:MAPEG family protein [Sulfitobacter marinus]SFS73419.1 MAPEG family protein [Sulfitobacter marinus]